MDQHTSYSRISAFLRCGLAYRFKYFDGLEPEFTPAALVLGSSFHRAIELFFLSKMEARSTSSLDELHDAFQQAWEDQAKSSPIIRYSKEGENAESQSELAGKMLQTFLDHVGDRDYDILAVEQRCSAELAPGLPPLLGFLDVVERTPSGELQITEIKTAARRYPEASAFDSLQLACYGAIAKSLGHQGVVQVKYLVITKAKQPQVQELVAVLDDPDVHRFRRIAQAVQDGVEKEVFIPNPGWQCSGCQWQGACREELSNAA